MRIHVQEYRGTEYLDVREFFYDASSDAWRPTNNGVTIRPDLYQEFLHGVVEAASPLGLDGIDRLDAEDGASD